MADLGNLRSKTVLNATMISFNLNMVSMGAVGRVEQEINRSGGILKDIQLAVNTITTHFISRNNYEGSIFTTYADDDKAVWKEFRRELRHEGFSSSTIHQHKRLIIDYIKELGDRGLLDEEEVDRHEQWHDADDVPQHLSPDESLEESESGAVHMAEALSKARIDEHSLSDERQDRKDAEKEYCVTSTETMMASSSATISNESTQRDEPSLTKSFEAFSDRAPINERTSSLANTNTSYSEGIYDSCTQIDETSPKGSSKVRGGKWHGAIKWRRLLY